MVIGEAARTVGDLIGRWRIVRWEQRYDDGRIQHPLGEDLEGFLQYDPDGRMFVMLARRERPLFRTGGQWDTRDAEHASAYRSMLTYAGTWERIGDEVVHHVELSLYPAWTGSDQRRRYEFRDDGTLALTARFEDGSREARTALLEWRRERLQQ